MAALALVLDSVDDLTDEPAKLAALAALKFDGASGFVDFNNVTFDRTASTVLYSVKYCEIVRGSGSSL